MDYLEIGVWLNFKIISVHHRNMASFYLDPMILLIMWYSNSNDVTDMNEKIANEYLWLIAFCGLLKTAYQSVEKFG